MSKKEVFNLLFTEYSPDRFSKSALAHTKAWREFERALPSDPFKLRAALKELKAALKDLSLPEGMTKDEFIRNILERRGIFISWLRGELG